MRKKLLLAVVLLFVAIQFIRPQRNLSTAAPGPDDVRMRFQPPVGVQHSLEVACYDCHSDNTRYPWYANVQPVGWWLANHVNEGKRHLNFSVIGGYPAKRQARAFNAISDQVSNHEMPLESYLWIHHDARLTDAETQALVDWSDACHDKVAPADE